MNFKVLNWNVRRAGSTSKAWDIIAQSEADVITLQEVNSIPTFINQRYTVYLKSAISKSGKKQIFSTAILVKGTITNQLSFDSVLDWVKKELVFFEGNILACEAKIDGHFPINIVSVYSPAWPIASERLLGIDVSEIKLKLNPNLWCTEILWTALKGITNLKNDNWIVSGDFNSSVTFDYLWKGGPSGNQEIVDRMNALGLVDCLSFYNGKFTPTFRNPKGGKIIHQIDHMYVTPKLLSSLSNSCVLSENDIFENSISDHLPILSAFTIDD